MAEIRASADARSAACSGLHNLVSSASSRVAASWAALSTFITNPLTVPFIYYLAYRVGSALLRIKTEAIFALSPDAGLIERGVMWTVALAGPTYVGLLVFAAVSAAISYFAVHMGWRIWVGQRWRRRQRQRLRQMPSKTQDATQTTA